MSFLRRQAAPKLRRCITSLKAGYVLIVVRLDRLARSTRDLLNVLAEVSERGAVSGHFPMHGLSIGVEPAPIGVGPLSWTVVKLRFGPSAGRDDPRTGGLR